MLSITELEEAGVVFVAKLGKNWQDEVYAMIEVTSHISMLEKPIVAAVMDTKKKYRGKVSIGGNIITRRTYKKISEHLIGSKGYTKAKLSLVGTAPLLSLTHSDYDDTLLSEVEGFSNWDAELKALIDKHIAQQEAIRAARESRRRSTGLSS